MEYTNHRYIEKIFQNLEKKLGMSAINATFSMDSHKTNVLTWKLCSASSMKAAIFLGPDFLTSIKGKNCNKIHEDQCRNVDDCRVHTNGTARMKCRIFRRISTEVRNAKTLTIVVRVQCLAWRRDPTQPIDVEKRVGVRDDRSVMH